MAKAVEMTDTQAARVRGAREFVLRRTVSGMPTQEIKEEEVISLANGIIEYTVTAGMPNDTNTRAEVFCRETYRIFISPRGAMEIESYGFVKRTKAHLKAIAQVIRLAR